MKDIKWLLFLYEDEERHKLFKFFELNTIKEIAYLLNMKPQEISNYYHKLIKERGPLKYCVIYQVSR